jgi:sulfide:quinone oxidoreductase
MRVVVVGGGIAGAEALLALHELAGDRAQLTLVTDGDELVLPPLSVAEPFALGHAPRYPLAPLLERTGAELRRGRLTAVAERDREIVLDDGARVPFDALFLAPGARAVARVEHATTWWPRGDTDAFSGMLRDLEEGYTKRVAFVIPAGAVWPLPLYELALMTAREVRGMGIDDVELTVVTPEAVPLVLFGARAASAVRDELEAAGIKLERASLARVDREPHLQVVLQPSGRRIEVDRVVAVPAVEGPAIPGTAQDSAGFIRVDRNGQMEGSETVWAAGDAIAYPIKYGGLAAQQADAAAAAIAARAGAEVSTPPPPRLRGVLLTGAAPRAIGGAREEHPAAMRMWRPTGKVFGAHLSPFLQEQGGPAAAAPAEPPSAEHIEIDEPLPDAPENAEGFHALWQGEHAGEDFIRELGEKMHDYEQGS